MLNSLITGVSGVREMQQQMDGIGNNIANINTTGFKGSRNLFSDSFSQTLSDNMQVGTGVNSSSIQNLFSQGTLTKTGQSTDMAISGNGFFVVKNATTGAEYVTRAGEFGLDQSGYLINAQGLRVQGFTDSGLSTRGDIQIDGAGAADPTAKLDHFSVDKTGKITVYMSDGTNFVRGQVLLQNFTNPQALVKEGGSLYSATAEAGGLAQTEAASTNGLGQIASQYIESSNVDLTTEFSSLITTQRAFQASARIITTSDEMLQEVVNLKR